MMINMNQIFGGIAAFFASILAMFGMGNQPMTKVTPTPTAKVIIASPTEDPSIQHVVYKGTSPCGDCSGIDVTLTLNYDGKDNISGTYSQAFAYQGKPTGNYTDTGTWKGLPNDVIELKPKNGGQNQYYWQKSIPTLEALGSNQQKLSPPANYTLTAN